MQSLVGWEVLCTQQLLLGYSPTHEVHRRRGAELDRKFGMFFVNKSFKSTRKEGREGEGGWEAGGRGGGQGERGEEEEEGSDPSQIKISWQ